MQKKRTITLLALISMVAIACKVLKWCNQLQKENEENDLEDDFFDYEIAEDFEND